MTKEFILLLMLSERAGYLMVMAQESVKNIGWMMVVIDGMLGIKQIQMIWGDVGCDVHINTVAGSASASKLAGIF